MMRNKNDEREGEKLQIVLEMIRGGLNGVGIEYQTKNWELKLVVGGSLVRFVVVYV